MAALVDLLPVPGADPSTVLDVFAGWANDGGRPLWAIQQPDAYDVTTVRDKYFSIVRGQDSLTTSPSICSVMLETFSC